MMLDKQKQWSEKSLTLFFLPTYSPELSIIEILSRFMKYNWLKIDAYQRWESLVKAVKYIFNNFGTEYIINFA
ncbi:transposase [Nostoc sp.]|uniref:transposase n=1 Tax=Nostoc sp. TaxID=1180 RepID=UPI003592FA1E